MPQPSWSATLLPPRPTAICPSILAISLIKNYIVHCLLFVKHTYHSRITIYHTLKPHLLKYTAYADRLHQMRLYPLKSVRKTRRCDQKQPWFTKFMYDTQYTYRFSKARFVYLY